MAPKADGGESHLINAIVEFQPDSNYHESYAGIRGSMVYKMYKTKFLNAVSIGFDPWEWEAVEEKTEGKTASELLDMIGTGGTHFTKWDMLEFSAVPVPSNPDALVDRKMRKEMNKELRTWATNTLVECERCNKTEDGGINKMDEKEVTIEKAGAVLSGPNKAKLQQASDNILSVLSSAEPAPNEPAAPAAPARPAPARPNAPPAASTEPEITASYPLGHEAPQMYTLDEAREIIKAEKADDVIPVVDDGEKPKDISQELLSIDMDVLAEITGIDVEKLLESLNAQGEGDKTTEE